MALTINRKDEIANSELDFIKQKFEQRTNSRAIYACVKYLVYQAPGLEEEIRKLKDKLKETRKKHNKLLKTIRKKHDIDTIYKEIASQDFPQN